MDLDQFLALQPGEAAQPSELPEVNPDLIEQIIARDSRGRVRERDPDFARNLVASAARHVGYSRTAHKDRIAQYLNVFGLDVSRRRQLPQFCAAGVAYAAAQSYARYYGVSTRDLDALRGTFPELDSYHFYPSLSVRQMMDDAVARGVWREPRPGLAPEPGWLVLFDWHQRHVPEHLGIVIGQQDRQLKTIEFNTSDDDLADGGTVAVKYRSLNRTVLGYIKTTA